MQSCIQARHERRPLPLAEHHGAILLSGGKQQGTQWRSAVEIRQERPFLPTWPQHQHEVAGGHVAMQPPGLGHLEEGVSTFTQAS